MKNTKELLEILRNDEIPESHQFLDLSFSCYLQDLMQKRGMTKSELIQKANIFRTYGYEIINGSKLPGKKRVIQLALALELDLHNTNNLLSLSQNGSLYAKVEEDAVCIYALNHHLSVMECNALLYERHLPLLTD